MKENMARRKDFEAQALTQLGGLYRTALYVVDNESDAQDLVQKSFARAYHAWDTDRTSPNCRTWLFGIMANGLINRYRPFPGLPAATSSVDEIDGYAVDSRWADQPLVDDYGHVPFSAISGDDVKKAIGNLPDDIRLIVVLSLLEGFSYREIAEIGGTTLETVRSTLHQGRKLMQRELFDHVGCEGIYDMPAGRVRSKRLG